MMDDKDKRDGFDLDEISLVTPKADDFSAPEERSDVRTPETDETPEIKLAAAPEAPEIKLAASHEAPAAETSRPKLSGVPRVSVPHREPKMVQPPPPPPIPEIPPPRPDSRKNTGDERKGHFKWGCLIYLLFLAAAVWGGYFLYTRYPDKVSRTKELLNDKLVPKIWKEKVSSQMPDAAPAADRSADAADDQGRTKLILAAGAGNVAEIRKLIADGADVKKADKFGNTALHYAVNGGNAEALEELLKNGADVNAVNQKGFSPLHLAAGSGNYRMVGVLVRAGADRKLRDSSGKLPEDYARNQVLKRLLH